MSLVHRGRSPSAPAGGAALGRPRNTQPPLPAGGWRWRALGGGQQLGWATPGGAAGVRLPNVM